MKPRSSTRKDPAIEKILLSSVQIRSGVEKLAKAISRDYRGKNLVLVGVLKGSVVFLSDLIRHLEIPCQVDFMSVASYGKAAQSSGVVRVMLDLRESPEGKDLLLVEDILDTGLTLRYLEDNLRTRKPKSLKVCAFLDKPENRKVDVSADYVGFKIPNVFVVGYGLDYAEKYRNLPYLGILKKEVYQYETKTL